MANDGSLPAEGARPNFSLAPVDPDTPDPSAPDPATDKIARDIIDDLEAGKSIDQIAADRSLTREQLIAQLEAAGYQVKIIDNGDIQSVELNAQLPDFVGPQLADKTVYYYDFQHDTGTAVTTKGDSVSTRTTKIESTTTFIDPKTGAEIKIVIDKDGRVTKTTIEKINDGKPIDYVVQPGDNLTSIAEKHGVTLDELRKSNPELFETPRDPNLIHPGEKVRIESGTRTTVEVTANGYTLTTGPDGKTTLHNNTIGTDLVIEGGSVEEALARTLLAVNPKSSDPAEAKEGEVVKSFVEAMLAAQTLLSLLEAANQAGADTAALIEKYGPGTPASPGVDGENRVVDPLGNPPWGKAPSGGDWAPINVGGVLTWVDPQVAQAISRQDEAVSKFNETRALAEQGMSQFDVHMLDPAYKGAVEGAQGLVNKALAPYGLGWTPEKPNGTLTDAQNKLARANTLLKIAQDAREAYEAAGHALDQAIKDQSELTPKIELDQELMGRPEQASEAALDYLSKIAQDAAEYAAVDKQFGDVSLHKSNGDKLTSDFLVGQAEMDGMSKESPEYKALKTVQETAASQLELAGAYQAYFDAHATSMDVDVHLISVDDATNPNAHATSTDANNPRAVLEAKLLAEYNAECLTLSESETEYTTRGGDYLGKLKSQTLEIRDGQLWVINEWANSETDVTVTEAQLTYDLGDKNFTDEYRGRQLNKEWQQLLGEMGPEALSSEDGLIAVKTAEAQAAKDLNDVLDRTIGKGLENLDDQLSTLQGNYDNLLKNSPGSIEVPPGTLQDGVQAVEIDVGGGRKIRVAPDVAERIKTFGLDALTQSGKAVWIDLDTSDENIGGLWVDPELAVAKLSLEAMLQQRKQTEQLHCLVKGFSAYHETHLKNPSLMIAPGNRSTDGNYLDQDQEAALDGIYQPKFQQLSANGFDETFHERRGSELEDTVATTLGIDPAAAEGRKTVEAITKEIRDIGGDSPKVCAVPFFYVDAWAGTQQNFLFAVQNVDGTRYVDATGASFSGLGDFQDNNTQFGDGKLVVPKGLQMKSGDDGNFELEVVKAHNFSVWEQGGDALVTGLTTIATVLSFVPPFAPVMAPIAYLGTTYLLTRGGFKQANYLRHGGELEDPESLLNMANMATMLLPTISSGLRFIGMAGRGMAPLEALRGSIGAASSGSATARMTLSHMKSTSGLNRLAWGADVSAVAIGTPLVAMSAHDLRTNWDQMSEFERTNALINLLSGVVGTGLGIHGLHTVRPGIGGDSAKFGKGRADLPPLSGDPAAKPARGPADTGPIIVPDRPVTADDPMHLVWNPERRGFNGVPERDASGYVYTSGKDERTPSAYLEELTSEAEKSYYSGRELAERYGPGGVYKTRTSLLSSQVERRNSGPMQIRDENGHFVTATRFGPLPKSAESVYVPPADGPQARGDEPDLMHKSHIFFRDPESGEAYVLPWTRGASEDHVPGGTGKPQGEFAETTKVEDVGQLDIDDGQTSSDRDENLTAFLARQPVHDVAEFYTDGRNLLSIEPHEFFLDAELLFQWGAGTSLVLDIHNPTVESIRVAQKLADIAGHDFYVPRLDAPQKWQVLAPRPLKQLAGSIEFDAKTGELNLLHADGTLTRIRPEDYLGHVRGSGTCKTAIGIGDKTLVIYREDQSSYKFDGRMLEDSPESMLARTRELEGLGAPYVARCYGIIQLYDGRYSALVMDNYVGSNLDFYGLSHKINRFIDIKYYSENSINSLEATKKFLLENNISLSDMQFLVSRNGTFWLADFLSIDFVKAKYQDSAEIIDQYIAVAKYAVEAHDRKANVISVPAESTPTAKIKAGKIVELADPSGTVFQAKILGTAPRKPEDVFVPPVDGPERSAKAAPGTAYTHHVVFPDGDEPVVLPLIRGASEDHVPGSPGHPEDGGQPVEGTDDPAQATATPVPATEADRETSPAAINVTSSAAGEILAASLVPSLGAEVPEAFLSARSGDLPSVFELLEDYRSPLGIGRGHQPIGYDMAPAPSEIAAVLSSVRSGPTQPAVLLPKKITPVYPIGLMSEHVNSLDKAELRNLSPELLRGMSEEDIARIALRQVRRLDHEQFEAIGGPRAAFKTPWRKALAAAPMTVSFLLSSARAFPEGSLVRTILETASGLAYGVRGLSFVTEAKFPNAAAAGKPLGTILRSVRLVTWPLNFANGFAKIDSGWGAASLGANQFGNLGYATIAWRELLTGKSATSWDKALLWGYVGGAGIDGVSAVSSSGPDLSYILPERAHFLSDGLEAVPGGANTIVSGLVALGSGHFLYETFWPSKGKGSKPPLLPRLSLGVLFGGALVLSTFIAFAAPSKDEEKPVAPPDEPPSPPSEPEEPGGPAPQLVVTAEDGLNLREEPSLFSERVVVLRPGSLAKEGGERNFDSAGNEWVLVRAYGSDGREYHGWVSADYVKLHPHGDQDTNGRFNPDLKKQGFEWVEVQPGQSIGTIARMHSVDVSDTVALNMDHILDPNMVFKGDKIYLPASTS